MGATKPPPILVADDDPNVLKVLEYHLKSWGCRCVTASDKSQLYRAIHQELPAVLLLDVRFGEHDGVEVLRGLLDEHPTLVIIMMTAFGTIDSAVAAIKFGAYDYLTKPPDLNRLKVLISDGIAKSLSQTTVTTDAKSSTPPTGQEHVGVSMIGDSPAIRRVKDLINGVAPTEASVLILGESGTGKEVTARCIHARSHRSQHPFIALNMAALPRELVESTLFGHEKGSFTGADQAQVGSVEAANHGTLFLDEIGEMDVNLQAKLLRFLQERTFQRVGASKPKPVDVRILAATNQDPIQQVRTGRLREDLYYRLNVVPIVMPPLRQRAEDIVPLARFFLDRVATRYGRPPFQISPEAADALTRYQWPGNVRQLENLIERLVIFSPGQTIQREAIPPEILNTLGDAPASAREFSFPGRPMGDSYPGSTFVSSPAPPPSSAFASESSDSGLSNAWNPAPEGDSNTQLPESDSDDPANTLRPIDRIEKQAIEEALNMACGNVREAAKALGLGQATVYRKIKRYAIRIP